MRGALLLSFSVHPLLLMPKTGVSDVLASSSAWSCSCNINVACRLTLSLCRQEEGIIIAQS